MVDYKKFWKDPTNNAEAIRKQTVYAPEYYLDLDKVTEMVTTTLLKYLPLDASILELGCGTGRNLAGLKAVGYTNLFGVEINMNAISLGYKNFPTIVDMPIRCAAVEDVINDLPKVDCIYSMGFFMHIPPASEWIFEVISNKARKIIMTAENEEFSSDVSWQRDYGGIFTGFGWKQLEREKCGKWVQLPNTTIKRVFEKEVVEDEDTSPRPSGKVEVAAPVVAITRGAGRKRVRKHTSN